MIVLIDGYNVIKKSGLFRRSEEQALEQARGFLIRLCQQYQSAKRGIQEIIIFFDGKEGFAWDKDQFPRTIQIYFSRGQTADQLLVDWLDQHPDKKPVTAVTDDMSLRSHARVRGAQILSVNEWVERLRPDRKPVSASAAKKKSSGNPREISVSKESQITRELKKLWGIE